MARIKVKAKLDAGYSPLLDQHIRAGQEYEMEEDQWGDQLFDRPDPLWLSPHELRVKEEEERTALAATPAGEPGTEPAITEGGGF